MRPVGTLLTLLLLLLGSGGLATAQGNTAFSLRPATDGASGGGAYFVYTIAAGTTKGDELLVLNSGDQPTTIDLYAVDALTGSTTGAVYANQGTPPSGPGAWIRLPQVRVTVPPQSTARVPFEVSVPAGARPGQHLAGLVGQPADAVGGQPTASAVGSSGQFTVTTTTRVVVAVAITVPGPLERKISVTGVRASTGVGGSQLSVGVRNDGNVLVKPTGQLVLRDSGGAERLRLPLNMDTILPGGAAEYAIPWPRELPAGDYTADVVLDTTDALPTPAGGAAAPAGAAGAGGATGAGPAGRAEYRSPPIAVKPATSQIPTPGAAAPTAPTGPVVAVASDAPWVAIAVAVGAALLIGNGAVAVYLLRRRREGTRSAAAAPAPVARATARTQLVPAPPVAAQTGSAAFVKGRGRTIYLLEGGQRRPFASWSAFVARGGSPTLANVRLLPDEALAALPEGPPIEDEARTA